MMSPAYRVLRRPSNTRENRKRRSTTVSSFDLDQSPVRRKWETPSQLPPACNASNRRHHIGEFFFFFSFLFLLPITTTVITSRTLSIKKLVNSWTQLRRSLMILQRRPVTWIFVNWTGTLSLLAGIKHFKISSSEFLGLSCRKPRGCPLGPRKTCKEEYFRVHAQCVFVDLSEKVAISAPSSA